MSPTHRTCASSFKLRIVMCTADAPGATTQHTPVQIRLAACWVVRNLIYPMQAGEQQGGREHDAETASERRAAALQEAGVATALTQARPARHCCVLTAGHALGCMMGTLAACVQLMITPLDSELAQRASRALEALHGRLVDQDTGTAAAAPSSRRQAGEGSASAQDGQSAEQRALAQWAAAGPPPAAGGASGRAGQGAGRAFDGFRIHPGLPNTEGDFDAPTAAQLATVLALPVDETMAAEDDGHET